MVGRIIVDWSRRAGLTRQSVVVLLLFSFALLLRLVYLSQITASPFFENPVLDAKEYDQWAKEIVNGKLVWDDYRIHAPLYPYFLAACHWFFGKDYYAATFVQFFLGSINCVLIYFVGRNVFNAFVGALAAFMACAYGVFIYFEGQLLYPVLAIFLDLLLVLGLLAARERPTSMRWLIAGAVLGLSAATKPEVLVLVPFVLAWIAYERERKTTGRRAVALGASFCVGVLLVVAPIVARNYQANGYLYLIQGHAALNLYIGNNPDSDGTPYVRPGPKWVQLVQWPIEQGLTERAQQERFFLAKVAGFLHDDPAGYLSLVGKKLYLFWNGHEIKSSQNIYFFDRYTPLMRLPLFDFTLVAPLALTGMLLALPAWRRALPLYLFVVAYQLAVVGTVVSDRYRLPVVPLLLVFAAFAVWSASLELIRRRYRLLIASLVPAIAMWVVASSEPWFLQARMDDFSEEHVQVATVYRNAGMYEAAADEYHQAMNGTMPSARGRQDSGTDRTRLRAR